MAQSECKLVIESKLFITWIVKYYNYKNGFYNIDRFKHIILVDAESEGVQFDQFSTVTSMLFWPDLGHVLIEPCKFNSVTSFRNIFKLRRPLSVSLP